MILHGCDEPAKKVVRYRGNTLQEVLNDIVTADPSYRWEVENGVVNLLPAKGVPNLLNLQIASYDSGEAWSLATAGAYLLALPQVRKRATVMGFSQGITGSGLSGAPPLGPPTPVRKLLGVRLQDVTLLEALNALVRANRHGEWIYHETHCQLENNFQVQFPE